MSAEQNPVWEPIPPEGEPEDDYMGRPYRGQRRWREEDEEAPDPLWRSAGAVIATYQRAERPVRSQRYSLVLTNARSKP